MAQQIIIDSERHSETAFRGSLTLTDLLRSRALEQPEQRAYTFLVDGETEKASFTYAELDRQARAVAAWLRPLVASGERVLLLYPPGLEYLAAFFGCLYVGAVAVPAYPPKRNRHLLRLQAIATDAEASVVLTTSPILSRAATGFAQNPYLKPLRWLATDHLAAETATDWQEPSVSSDDLAFLQYTSGSTGTPKGVMLTHANLLHNAALVYQACEHTPTDSYVSWLPTFHDMGFMAGILQPLYGGFPVVLMSPAAFLQRPVLWLEALTRYRATTSGGPNFAYDLCVRKITPQMRETLDLSNWSVAFNGAEPIRAKTLEQFAEAFAPCGFRAEAFYPCYGLAEATLMVSGSRKLASHIVATVDAEALENNRAVETSADDEEGYALVGCGRTLMGQKVIAVDPVTLTECAPDEIGEIWVSGQSVAQGYWNRPEETELTFQAYLPETGDGPFLRTGDLGFMRDGELFVTGRLKDLIVIRGRNHYPQDIELTVEQCHAALRPGCGAAFSIDVAGEERLVVVQEVDQRRAAELDLHALIENISQAIAEEHDLQAYALVLIEAGTIPKTSSGKIQRHAARAAFLESSLETLTEWRAIISSAGEQTTTDEATAFESVEAVAAWFQGQLAARLGLSPSDVDMGQPITRYGLDSMMAIELKHSIESRLGVVLPILNFFDSPSISQIAANAFAQLASAAQPSSLNASGPTQETNATRYLSRGQQSLWFLHRLAPESAAYNISRAVRISSTLEPAALRRAFQALVDRHASLRTTFSDDHGEPLQQIHERVEVCFEEVEASGWSHTALMRHLSEEAHRPFNLETGPLLRLSLFTRPAGEHILLLTIHHIVTDFWSLAVLVHELGQLYEQEIYGSAATLPPLNLQYGDYVRWQETMLASEAGDQLWSYWREQLSGELPALNLPTDRPRPPVQTYRGAALGFKLDETLTRGLKALGQAQGATLYMTLLAAFQALLSRYSNQREILVGSPTANRNWAALSDVVGYFVNTVVLRADLSQDPSFETLLEQTRRTVLAAFEHQDYPFALLVERLQPERDASRSPLFQVMFVLQKGHLSGDGNLSAFALGEAGARMDLGALSLESLPLEQRVVQFDLTLMMTETGDGLSGAFEYNTDLFDKATIERMVSHFQTLLASIVAAPERPTSRLPLLSVAEEYQLLVEWNDTQREYTQGRSMTELFEAQAERTPAAVALICEDERLTYAELNAQANQLAHYLRRLGVGPEVLVGLLAERSREMVVGLLGILKAGGAYVPLDPSYPQERLAFMLKDTQAPMLLTQERLIENLPEHQARIVCLDTQWKEIAAESVENLSPQTRAENLAYVIYTSGSTGRPKGVAIAHRSALAFLHWARGQFEPEDLAGTLASTSICFDLSIFELFAPLSWGGAVVLAANALHLPTLAAAPEVTLINTVPSAMNELLASGGVPSSVRAINLAGEQLHGALVEQIYRQETVERVFNLYGPSEDTTYSTFTLVEQGTPTPSIGRPVDNTQVYLLDGQMQAVAVGVAGELYIGGEGLARGYLNRPELTAERFIPDPFSEQAGARLYRTGDLARRLPNGEIDYLGRIDQQIKLRGFRIELGEIEAMLGQHPSVRECVAIAREDTPGDKRLVAYIVSPEERPAAGQLRSYLKGKLPEYMIPAFFVFLDELPLTSNGKVNRRALPAPDKYADALEESFSAPQTPTEEVLAGIWAEVLDVERVGINDNFFELGGHSLLVSRVLSRVVDAFQVGLPMRSLFELPTVAELAESIEKARSLKQDSPWPAIKRVSREQNLPLSYAQQRLWFVDQLGVANGVYNIPAALHLKGRLNLAALEWSLNEIVRRHESLRTTFQVRAGQPAQVISAPQPFSLPFIDLSQLPESERAKEVEHLAAAEAQRPFDLAGGPLLRVMLLRLGTDEHVLLWVMHHIIGDGWSLGVLLRELTALYENFDDHASAPLSDLPIQYTDYAVWQSENLRGHDVLERQLEYWEQQLAGAPALLELPTDHPRPPAQSYRGATHPLAFGRSLTEQLKKLGRQENVTLFMLLLAALQTLLMRYTGQTDVLVSTGAANRNRAETESLIGCLINILVLRADLSRDPGFDELLARVREVTLEAYAHQEAPFELLVERLQP
ncbi:MAG TPA: amino acid adenylation domain-containing protein, partial [Pyrinomonadaceae bacterium]